MNIILIYVIGKITYLRANMCGWKIEIENENQTIIVIIKEKNIKVDVMLIVQFVSHVNTILKLA
jgi:hypothetical protein